jgi:hypothetical protein
MTGGVLALDVATTTGWAVGLPGERPVCGHHRAGKPGCAGGEVLAQFADWLEALVAAHAPVWIAFEAPYVPRVAPRRVRARNGAVITLAPHNGPPIDNNVIRRLYGLCGLVELTAHRHRIACREAGSSEICKFFTGNGSWGGRANKKAATMKMAAVYGFPGVTEDEADALALWVYAEAVLFPKAAARRGAGPLFVRMGWGGLP